MKIILKIFRRLVAVVYAVAVSPIAFVSATVIMTVSVLMIPVEWIITGKLKYTTTESYSLLQTIMDAGLTLFRKITGD